MAADLPMCKYGKKCYRRNPEHLKQYRHDSDVVQSSELPESRSPNKKDDKPSNEPERRKRLSEVHSEESGSSESKKARNQTTLHSFFTRTASKGGMEKQHLPPAEEAVQSGNAERTTDAGSSESNEHARPVSGERNKRDQTLFAFDFDSATNRKCVDNAAHGAPLDETNARRLLTRAYNIEMPSDFWAFWRFCSNFHADAPLDALVDSLELRLVGPFELLANQIDKKVVQTLLDCDPDSKSDTDSITAIRARFACYYRFFYDPPEFQTLLVSQRTPTLHFGYVRDDPRELPAFCASNDAGVQSQQDAALFTRCGTDLFELVADQLDATLADSRIGASRRRVATDLRAALERFCKDEKISLPAAKSASASAASASASRTKRVSKAPTKGELERGTKVKRNVVCTLWNGLGLSVPVRNDVGYRPVPESATKLRNLFEAVQRTSSEAERSRAMGPIYELVTLCQFANDEGDYGEALELGLNAFASGCDKLHATVLNLLPIAYELGGRGWYGQIVRAHLQRRTRRYEDLSVL